MSECAAEQLENYEMRLWLILSAELANGARWISYSDLQKRIGAKSRSTVTYNIGKRMSAGLVGIEDGKIYLK